MTLLTWALALGCAAGVLALPRRWAALPLLAATCFLTPLAGIDVASLRFTIVRMVIAAGIVRVLVRGERPSGGLNTLDALIVAWCAWICLTGSIREDPERGLAYRLGIVYNSGGAYFLLRVFITSLEDVKRLAQALVLVLIPVALEMMWEARGFPNLFAWMGGVLEPSRIREGRVRAFGSFAHPILAGTVGAVCLPFVVGLWRDHRKLAVAGIVACLSMVVSSASTGPVLTLVAAVAALAMWRFRRQVGLFVALSVVCYILLDLVMRAPAYYLVTRIDVFGGSKGWHRIRLIESAFAHLNEWWLAGTSHTRHWMPTGVSWSPNHTDITNYYLHLGVVGGLPLLLLFVLILAKAFGYVRKGLLAPGVLPPEEGFFTWTLWAALFAHAVTLISVSYYDQSFLFLYLTLAAVSSCWAAHRHPLAVAESARRPFQAVGLWRSGRVDAGAASIVNAAGMAGQSGPAGATSTVDAGTLNFRDFHERRVAARRTFARIPAVSARTADAPRQARREGRRPR